MTQELEAQPPRKARGVSSPDWMPGDRTAVLNEAAQDVRTWLQSQANTLKNYNPKFLATRTAIRVSLLLFCFFILVSFCGGVSAHPLGVVPEFRAGC